MAKKTTNSKATATADETSATASHEDTATVISAVSDPSGENGPDGTHNPESESPLGGSGNPAAPAEDTASGEGNTDTARESGDAAGDGRSGDAEPVKPLTGSDPAEATVAEAVSPTIVSLPPEVEASASGTSSESSSQEAAAGDAGANAGVSAALTAEQANAILSQVLGVTIKERRKFIVWKPVRHDNVLYGRGGTIIVDELTHIELAAKRKVSPSWETGILVEG